MKKIDLQKELSLMARQWPRPGELVFYVEPDHVWLHKIRLPVSHRGQGTRKMAEFLALVDRAGLPVCLTADPMPSDEDNMLGHPQTFDLVKWYMRFGFVPHGPSEDGFLMERPACPGNKLDNILSSYEKSKKHDLTLSEFQSRWVPQHKVYRSFP